MKPFKWIVAGMVLGCSSALASAAVNLVEGGKAVGRIVVPAKATEAETFAARQVQRYVKDMSGATLEIVQPDAAARGPAILIGRVPANQGVIDRLNQAHPNTIDAFAVVGKGDRLSLVGRSDDSTLWAAWQWLEDQGVRFLLPSPHGTFVPRKADIALEEINDIEAPRVAVRGNYGFRPTDKTMTPPDSLKLEDGRPLWELYALRMRMNRNRAFNEKDRYVFLGGGGYYTVMTPQKYFKAHPEWFNMKNGKRQGDGSRPHGAGWQLCFTNKGAAAQYAANLNQGIQRYLNQGIPLDHILVLVTPNDGVAMCECPNCKKLIDKNGSATSMVVTFANNVAAEIQKTYPDARIMVNAYSNYSTPPDHVKPGRNVCPILTQWPSADSFGVNNAHPLFSKQNKKFADAFAAWEAISDGIGNYAYYGHYEWITPWPVLTQMSHDIKHMSQNPKYFYQYSETHLNWGTQSLTYWLFGKLTWNPDLDVDAAIRDFCRASFGPAAQAMEKYYKTLQASMDRQGWIGGSAMQIPQVLTPEVISQCDALIARAEQAMDRMDPDMRWRTELACQSWHYSAKLAEAIRLFQRGKTPQDRLKVIALCDEVDAFSKTELGMWAFEQRRAAPVIGRFSRPLKVDLNDLSPGKHDFNDSFMFGGGIKFFAKIRGMRAGMWGFLLLPNQSGQIDLPIRARQGSRIASMKVKWRIPRPERLAGSLSVVSEDGKTRVLTTDLKQMIKGVAVPADLLGGTLRLKVNMLSQFHDPTIILTGCALEMEVK